MSIRLSSVLLVAFLFVAPAFAQKNFSKEADKAYKNMEFFNAIELYKKAYSKAKKKEEKASILFKTAECYRKIGDSKQAETWYAKAVKAKYPDPKAILYLADAKKIQQKYDEAIVEYNNYKKEVPSDTRGADGVKSCEMAQKWKDNPTRFKVDNMAMLNSKQQDFAPGFADKKGTTLYFTSTREGSTGGKTDPGLGQTYSDIFETKVDKNGKWSTPTPVAEPLNTPANDGSSVVAKKGNTIYFTRCEVEKNKEKRCQLFMATKKGSSWGDEKKLPFCVDSFAFGHPSVSADEKLILFTSDMSGGQGGRDIWYAVYDSKAKQFGSPINLGPTINTSGDEMYPFLHEDGSLYFSSNGHIGMGGLDIFKAEKKGDNNWANVTNLQAPINSAGDDFSIIFEGKKERGYFASNREGGKGSDDLYSFVLPPVLYTLEGVISDCASKGPLEGVTVRLVGSDGTNVEMKTDKAGYYRFSEVGNARYINMNTSYVISTDALALSTVINSAGGTGYLNSSEKGRITTVGEKESKTFKQDFCLVPNNPAGIKFPAVMYDLNKADLRPESKDSLNFLYQTLIDNPTLVVSLDAHTDFRGTDKSNIDLSQRRAQSCVDYLIKEKGIPAERLSAKGWGESKPICLEKDKDGKCLQYATEQYITKQLKTKEEQEAVHQKNRRTVFRVLRWDYQDPNAPKPLPKVLPKVEGGEGEDYGDEEAPVKLETAPTTIPAPTNTTPATTPNQQPKATTPQQPNNTNKPK
ncbi:MAG: OmpA family protein [Bacteroidetes bacterium]|nr:OmpA family protein [Bacteroidota bacterium]